MTPEAAQYLVKDREDLSDARQIAAIGLAKVAARSAYYAAFHAAEAYIVVKTVRTAKSHSGTRREFARLANDKPRLPRSMTTFLAQAYRYKEIGDYGLDPNAVITLGNTQAAIRDAGDFLDRVQTMLT